MRHALVQRLTKGILANGAKTRGRKRKGERSNMVGSRVGLVLERNYCSVSG